MALGPVPVSWGGLKRAPFLNLNLFIVRDGFFVVELPVLIFKCVLFLFL